MSSASRVLKGALRVAEGVYLPIVSTKPTVTAWSLWMAILPRSGKGIGAGKGRAYILTKQAQGK